MLAELADGALEFAAVADLEGLSGAQEIAVTAALRDDRKGQRKADEDEAKLHARLLPWLN